MKLFILSSLIFTSCVYGTEYLYPVISIPDSDYVLVIYQKTPHHIELWQWNSRVYHAEHILLSRYTPAGLKLLPHNTGYSFIDNDLIKVKRWEKRSPRTVELDAPVSNVEHLHWIDEKTCYTSGKYCGKFGVFQIDLDGNVYPLCMNTRFDCMYPQKIENTLFCIERDRYRQYRIIKAPYQPQGIKFDEFNDRLKTYHEPSKKVIFESGLQPIIFLSMISKKEGFYLSHPRAMSRREKRINFDYCYLYYDREWHSELLFSFSIPTSLILTGKASRLYEALLPILPRYIEGSIFFSDMGESNNLNIFRFDCASRKTEPVTAIYDNEQQFFVPIMHGSACIYGGRLCDQLKSSILKMGIVDRQIQFQLGTESFEGA